jgi:hypothetical protein
MGLFKRVNWDTVFATESEVQARLVFGLLKGHELEVKLVGDPTQPYPSQPLIRGIAGRFGRYLIMVPEKKSEQAQNLIRDYLDREGERD